jgi:hypothetical protein
VQADDAVVGGQRHGVDLFSDTGSRPRLEPAADGGVRTLRAGDAFVARPVHQCVNQVFEDHPVGDATPVTAQWVIGIELAALGQLRGELDPDGVPTAMMGSWARASLSITERRERT